MAQSIGLVLAGGGARGAYEVGVLSELLPWLEEQHGERPDVVVGTSVGALNASYIAAHADEDMPTLISRGAEAWRQISYRDVLEPLLSLDELVTVWRLAVSVAFSGVMPYSLLDPGPLAKTLRGLVDFTDIHRNIEAGALRACAVVAVAGHSNRSTVFHDGGPSPPSDERRGIDYFSTRITGAHARASAAIPVLFPAVPVDEPASASGWYFDGGTRLNTPIKPALELGVDRVIVVGLNSLAPAPPARGRPDLFDGASQIIQGLLVDPVINDIATLVRINEQLRGRGVGGGADVTGPSDWRVVPYIFIAPPTPNVIGKIAGEVYRRDYGTLRGLGRSRDLALLGRLMAPARSPTRGELFSYLFFAPEFAARLLELGKQDARRWIEQRHDDGAWQVGGAGA
jgi:NTE family protein